MHFLYFGNFSFFPIYVSIISWFSDLWTAIENKNTCLQQRVTVAKYERSNTNHDFGHDEDSQYIKNKKHKFFRHWAGIKPIIRYCRSDHRLGGLLQESLRILHQCHAYSGRIQLQKSYEASFVFYWKGDNMMLWRTGFKFSSPIFPHVHIKMLS